MARIPIKRMPPKKCFFCEGEKEPSFSDIDILKRYVTERQKIVARTRSGICASHQRELSRAIKQARFLALLPFAGQRG